MDEKEKLRDDCYIDCFPVRTEGSGTRYDGRVWYENLSTLKNVSGVSVDLLKLLLESW